MDVISYVRRLLWRAQVAKFGLVGALRKQTSVAREMTAVSFINYDRWLKIEQIRIGFAFVICWTAH